MVDGLDVVIATSCAILGPNDFRPSRMGKLLLDFANGRLRAYIPGGFEFVAARDIADGHLLAMAKGRPGQKYIFATEFMTVDELMDIYEAITGPRRPRLRLPAPMMLGLAHATTFAALHRSHAPRASPPARCASSGCSAAPTSRRRGRSSATSRRRSARPSRSSTSSSSARTGSDGRAPRLSPCPSRSVRRPGSRAAPSMPGGLPWLGHALEFRRDPVAPAAGRKQLGAVFAFRLPGTRVTASPGPGSRRVLHRAGRPADRARGLSLHGADLRTRRRLRRAAPRSSTSRWGSSSRHSARSGCAPTRGSCTTRSRRTSSGGVTPARSTSYGAERADRLHREPLPDRRGVPPATADGVRAPLPRPRGRHRTSSPSSIRACRCRRSAAAIGRARAWSR